MPVLGWLLDAVSLMLLGFWEVLTAIHGAFDTDLPLKDTVVGLLTAVYNFVLAKVLLVVGYGL